MSHYNANVSVPKTLIQYLIRWVISSKQFNPETNEILEAILETEISPELVPHETGKNARPAQKTAEVVGPYELQDFNLYHISRYGFRPSKVAFLALHAWGSRDHGEWPDLLPNEKRNQRLGGDQKWLEVFLYRFFKTSQFKRSAIPNGPKVGSGGSPHRVAIGGRRAIQKLLSGWRNSGKTCLAIEQKLAKSRKI
jgi:NAD+ synthase (glutamine-hydrolysing)